MMKMFLIAPLALALAACSEGASNGTAAAADTAAGEVAGNAAAIAANTRPDGSVIDESKPHKHTDANAHGKPMDHTAMMDAMMPKPNDSAATKGYKQSMMRMMEGSPPYTGDADIDFNKQMRVHHLAAVDMAEAQLANGKDAETKALAQKIITEQKKEIAQIDAWLQQRGQ
jgi:hypothetical protein